MKMTLKFASLVVLTASLAGLGAARTKPKAAPTKPATKAAPAKAATCPVCHMTLSAKKTKTDTVAVQLKKGDKVMYCCAGCKMPASILVKGK